MGCNCEGKTINIGMGCCVPTLGPVENYYTKQQVDKLISAVTVSGVSEEWVEDYTYDKTTIDSKDAEKLAVSDFQAYSGTVASELSRKASQSTVDTLSGQIQSISSSTSGDVTVISGDVITISGNVTSLSNDLSAHTANTSIHVTTAQTSTWDAKQNALTAGSGISIANNVISVTGGTEGITSAQCQAQIDQSISGKTNQSDFSAHTANTSIHVTTAQTASWDAKSNFSGSYNDLTDKPTIPTVPTSNTAFTNDAGYITSSALNGYAESTAVTAEISAAVSGKTNESDFSAHTANTSIHVTTAQTASWDAKSNFSGSYNDLTDKPTIPTVPTSNTAFTNDAGYITNDALNGYAESTAVTAEISAAVSGKTNESDFSAHTANTTVHVTSTEKNTWNAKADVWVGDETAWSQISGNTQQGVIYLVY